VAAPMPELAPVTIATSFTSLRRFVSTLLGSI
jgi:hypothetical protein